MNKISRPQIQILFAPLNPAAQRRILIPTLPKFSARTHTKTIAGVLPQVHERSHVSTCSSPAVPWDIMLPNCHIHHSICSYSTPLAKAGEQRTSILPAGRTEYCSVSEYSATVEFLSACGKYLSPYFQHALRNAYSYARIFLYVYGALATRSITGASAQVNITAT